MTSVEAPRYCYRHPDRETGLSCSECGRPICYECMTPAAVGLRCPEHSGQPQGVRRVTSAAERAVTGAGRGSVALVTRILIGINVFLYLAELAFGGDAMTGTGNWIYTHGALINSACCYADGTPLGVAHGEWWRLLTAAFLHYGPLHLGLNMLALHWFGTPLETIIGRWRFLLLYVASGLAGSAGALLWKGDAITVGASGAIFGVLGALFILERRGLIQTGGQLLLIIILNLAFTFSISNISIGGHLGGLVGGIVAMLVLLYDGVLRSSRLSLAVLLAIAVASVAVAYAAV